MPRRINWHLVLVGYFLGSGLYLGLKGRWLEGAWSAVFGLGGLGIIYVQHHPQRGVLGYALFIGWIIILGWLTLQIVSQ